MIYAVSAQCDEQVGLNFMNWANPDPGASTGQRGHRVFLRNRVGTLDAAEGPYGIGFFLQD